MMDIPLPPEMMDPDLSNTSDGTGVATVASVGLYTNGRYENRTSGLTGTGSESQMNASSSTASDTANTPISTKEEISNQLVNGNASLPAVPSPVPSTSKDPDVNKPPELRKLWKPLRTNPADFAVWTILLSYVEQQEQISYIREAYDAFFSRYPYCYGYWKKYSELEKRFGTSEQSEAVIEQGVQSIPLSIELWMYYIEFAKDKYKGVAGEGRIRQLFGRAVDATGLDFKSDDLWDAYIQWEKSIGQQRNVFNIYERLLQIPTLHYARHYEEFQQLVQQTPLQDLITPEEMQTFRLAIPEEAIDVEAAIRQMIIDARRPLHVKTEEEAGKRWMFEQNIRRPYFHIKPLESSQLKNWSDYLDFEIGENQAHRTIFLFERCLVACALYEEFWRKYFDYLKKEKLVEYSRYAYQRVCTYHLPNKTGLHLEWAGFEEEEGTLNGALQALQNGLKHLPNKAVLSLRQIGLLRRMQQDPMQIQSTFDNLIHGSEDAGMVEFFLIKQARYHLKIKNDKSKAMEIIRGGLKRDPTSTALITALIDCELQQVPLDVAAVIRIFDEVLAQDGITHDQKLDFLERKIFCLEDFGMDIRELRAAHRQFYEISVMVHRGKKRAFGEDDDEEAVIPKKPFEGPAMPTIVPPHMATYSQAPVSAVPQVAAWPAAAPAVPVAAAPYAGYAPGWPPQYGQSGWPPYQAAST